MSRFFYVPSSRLPNGCKSAADAPIQKGRGGITGEALGPIGVQIERFLLNPAREKPQELSQVSPHFGVTTILAPLIAVQPRKRDATQHRNAASNLTTPIQSNAATPLNRTPIQSNAPTPRLGSQPAPLCAEVTAMLDQNTITSFTHQNHLSLFLHTCPNFAFFSSKVSTGTNPKC